MPKDPKDYNDLKTPADFPEDNPSDNDSDTPPDDNPPDDTPPVEPNVGEQLTQISETLTKLGERMNSLEDNVITPPSKPTEGEFTPDFEKGQYLPPDYKPKTYNEFVQKTLEIARQAEDRQSKQISAQEQRWNEEWTAQLDQLTKEGKIPPVKDPADRNDLGRKARAQLLIDAATAGSVNLVNFYRATEKYRKGGTTPPSSRAPVGPGRTGGAPPSTTKSYDDLKKPAEQVLEEKYPDLVSK